MHEMSIAVELRDRILEVAAQNGLEKVEAVVVETGALRQIIAEVMQTAFSAVTKDTLAEGARLQLVEVPALVRCRRCRREFSPLPDNYMCPDCRVAAGDVIRGEDIVLTSVSGISAEGAGAS